MQWKAIWGWSVAASAVLLAACAPVPAVVDIRQGINYQQDAVVDGNQALFGFRSLPKRAEAAAVSETAGRPVAEVSQCVQQQLQSQFKLPEDFYQVKTYADNAQTVALVNPFTKKEGLLFDISPSGVNSSEIRLYANGATLSNAWKRLPTRCR